MRNETNAVKLLCTEIRPVKVIASFGNDEMWPAIPLNRTCFGAIYLQSLVEEYYSRLMCWILGCRADMRRRQKLSIRVKRRWV